MTVGAGAVGNITNSYMGYQTGTTTSGTGNTAFGYRALRLSTSSRGTAFGTEALAQSTGSGDSVAIGYRAVYTATGNSGHCGVGSQALTLATGGYNTALGFNAGSAITTGSGNLVLGTMTSAGSNAPAKSLTTNTNEISIGTTSTTAATIQVAWTVLSDARDKINVEPVPHGLSFVAGMNPVKYQLTENRGDTEPHGPVRYGFLAQEVLALEGETPVIINNEDPDKLRYTDSYLLPVLVQAIKELKAEFDAYKASHP
jgi:hypothetical protein